MVGGIVVSVWIWETDTVSCLVRDNKDYAEVNLVQDCNSLTILRGDSLWWQGKSAFWTPKDDSLSDVEIPRIGYSNAVYDPIGWHSKKMADFGGNER